MLFFFQNISQDQKEYSSDSIVSHVALYVCKLICQFLQFVSVVIAYIRRSTTK